MKIRPVEADFYPADRQTGQTLWS